MKEIKIIFNSKEMNIQAPINYEELKNLCQKEFKIGNIDNYIIIYKDDDKDDVYVEKDNDYTQALNFMTINNILVEFMIKEKINQNENNVDNPIGSENMVFGNNNNNNNNENKEDNKINNNNDDSLEINEKKLKEEYDKNYKEIKEKYKELEKNKKDIKENYKKIKEERVKKKKEKVEKKKKKKNERAKQKKEQLEKKKKEEEEMENNKLENNNNIKIDEEKEKLEINKEYEDKQNNNNNIFKDDLNKLLDSIKETNTNDLKNQILKSLEKKVKKIKNALIKKTSEKNDEIITNYIDKLNKLEEERQIKYQSELSKYSQNRISMSVCNTIHNGIKCEKCGINPIQGIRYKCSICDNYNLCELCEDLNSELQFHNNQHDFIRMRNEKKKKDCENNNILYQNQDIIIFNYECLTQEPKIIINEGIKKDKLELLIQNSNGLPWINETKFICNKMHSNVIVNEIKLPNLNIGEQTKIFVNFDNLEQLTIGKYKSILEFSINNKIYGKPLNIFIEVKNEKLENALKQIRDCEIDEKQHPNDKVIGLLKKHNYDVNKVLNYLLE
jgi:hypothetical protein